MISCWMVKLTCRHGTSEYFHDRLRRDRRGSWSGIPSLRRREAFARLAVAVADDTGFSAQKAGAHFLMQMAVLWTRPMKML